MSERYQSNPHAKKMQTRIDRGVRWLNACSSEFWDKIAERYDRDAAELVNGAWVTFVDLDELDLSDTNCCILGQISGTYLNIIRLADLEMQEASRLGFVLSESEYRFQSYEDANDNMHHAFSNEDYSYFTELWIKKIRTLRAALETIKKT
jgi:hypothetical protein